MYEVYEERDYFFIITELCTGKELFDILIKEKCFKEAKVK
jgi:calcium-dependent protein kinase